MHDDDVEIGDEVARALIDGQFPGYAGLPLQRWPTGGTVNVIFRLGLRLSARFPRRREDADASRSRLEAEADRAAEFAVRSPFNAPEPVAIGEPACGYPMAWSLHTWIPGDPASPTASAGSARLAGDLATLVTALRATPTRGRRFSSGGRGGDLRSHDEWVAACLERSDHLVDVPALERLWERLRVTPRQAPDLMTHGDLTPGNLLVANGRLAGVLDAGGFGPADPALDLIVAWHVLDEDGRDRFRRLLRCDDMEWDRGKGWALEQALGAAWYYERTNPQMHEMGMTTLHRLMASER